MGTMGRIKGYFFRGLAVLLPTVMTIWIFFWAYYFIQERISVHINRGLVQVMAFVGQDYIEVTDAQVRIFILNTRPDLQGDETQIAMYTQSPEMRQRARIDRLEKVWVEGHGSVVGFVVALVSVCAVGAVLASMLGRTLWRAMERFIMGIPMLRRVYPYVKQVTDFVLTKQDQGKVFSKVVAVEYPRKGIWSIGFVTGEGWMRGLGQGREWLRVMIPTSPTPVTGYVIIVPKEDAIIMDMTTEEAFRFIISAGVIGPGEQYPAQALPLAELPAIKGGAA